MKMTQVYDLVNQVTKEIVGETAVVNQDLTNVVDIGKQIFDTTDVDNYVRTLIDHIGRVIFVNRPYSGNAPSVLMDGWEYGSIMEKITGELPEATENQSWDLQDQQSYDFSKFYKPQASAKFYNKRVTFEVDLSYTEMQVKSSFSSAAQLNGFFSMLTNEVEKSLTIKLDGLIKATINSMIADTIYDAYSGNPVAGQTSVRAVNLLKLYQDEVDSTMVDPAIAVHTPEFIRFAVLKIKLYMSRMSNASRLFNIGNKVRFTTPDLMHVILLNDFKSGADVYLQSDTYNDEFTALPKAEVMPYWQGPGTDYLFGSTSKINVTSGSGHAVEADGILGVMFDRDALGVTNLNQRVTSNYNPKAEFFTNYYKRDAQYFNDGNEQFVVFYAK